MRPKKIVISIVFATALTSSLSFAREQSVERHEARRSAEAVTATGETSHKSNTRKSKRKKRHKSKRPKSRALPVAFDENEAAESEDRVKDTSGKSAPESHPSADALPRADEFRGNTDLYTELHLLSTMVIPAVGVTFGSRIAEDQWLEVNYTYGSIKLKTVAGLLGVRDSARLPSEASSYQADTDKAITDIERLSVYHSTFALRLKSYWTDSFYTNIGVAQRSIGFAYPVNEVSEYRDLQAEANVKKNGLVLDLGNRWYWHGIHFGIDWLSAFVPFEQMKKPDKDASQTSSPAQQFNKVAAAPTIDALSINFGYAL